MEMTQQNSQVGTTKQEAAQSETYLARQRKRSIAIALTLALLVFIFYMLTIVKMGPELFDRVL